jgi:hypothetical protein
MKRNTRKVQRFAVQLPCKFGKSDDMKEGTILNLSPQGCAIMADLVPAVSSYISLEMDLLNGTGPVDIELAGVRWVSGQRCGVEFIRVLPEMLMRLQAFALLLEKTP